MSTARFCAVFRGRQIIDGLAQGWRMAALDGGGGKTVRRLKAITAALAVQLYGVVLAFGQTVTLDAAAQEVPVEAVVSNAATLMLFDLRCGYLAANDADVRKSQINTYAAVGERQVGRDAFRKAFFEALAVRRQQLAIVGDGAWCERVAAQIGASNSASASRPTKQ